MQSMDSISMCLGYLIGHPGIKKAVKAKWLEGSLTISVWPNGKARPKLRK